VASNKLEKGPNGNNETAFASPLALTVWRSFFYKFAVFTGFWPKCDLEMKVKVKSQT
jgi:hypothetical protein